eukprot:RCo004689
MDTEHPVMARRGRRARDDKAAEGAPHEPTSPAPFTPPVSSPNVGAVGPSSSAEPQGASFPAAGLVAKEETQVAEFLRTYPECDGRGVIAAVLDYGVDPDAPGLQHTTDGRPKIIAILDCCGAGDVDTSTIRMVNVGSNTLQGLTGRVLTLGNWTNPSGKFHVGKKRAYEFLAPSLVARLKAERKACFQQQQMSLLAKLSSDKGQELDGGSVVQSNPVLAEKLLQQLMAAYDDPGPVYDCVVFHDGNVWRAAIDFEETGNLSEAPLLTDFSMEKGFGTVPSMLLSYSVNIYDEGNLLSICVPGDSHGTHVASILAGYFPESPELNGVAPGAQLVCCNIADPRLSNMESGVSLARAAQAAAQLGCDLVNLSFWEPVRTMHAGHF